SPSQNGFQKEIDECPRRHPEFPDAVFKLGAKGVLDRDIPFFKKPDIQVDQCVDWAEPVVRDDENAGVVVDSPPYAINLGIDSAKILDNPAVVFLRQTRLVPRMRAIHEIP